MAKLIKDIYEYDYIENPETSLLKRMNSILAKTVSQLSLVDVCTLVRQECFLDIAIPKAITFIVAEPSVGDNYPFSLLKNLSEIRSYPEETKPRLAEMISLLNKKIGAIDFEDEEESLFRRSVELIEQKL